MVNALPAVVFKGGNKNCGCYAKKEERSRICAYQERSSENW